MEGCGNCGVTNEQDKEMKSKLAQEMSYECSNLTMSSIK
jgi:hypothetical protein